MSRSKSGTTKPEASPAASITPEALKALFDSMNELKATVAKYEAEAKTVTSGMTNGKAANAKVISATKVSMAGKTDQQIKNEIAVVKAFKKAGFGDVKPHVDVLTFNKWVAKGFRPVEGTKSLKIANLRLFHKSQVRPVTKDELKAIQADQTKAIERQKAKMATVTPLHPQ